MYTYIYVRRSVILYGTLFVLSESRRKLDLRFYGLIVDDMFVLLENNDSS
jgi:hypothetical protein